MPALAIDVHSLTKRYGGVTAVAGLDLAVEGGQIVGLVGPDGAGKSTTMRLLCGIVDPNSGSAMVAGRDVIRDPEGVKARVGYQPQRFALHRDLTVQENIAYLADLYQVPRGTWRQRSDELLEVTYLSPFRDRLAGDLSGGMRQKLALVCTLIHRPEVVLLDEPTTGVDPVSRRDFWKILSDLPRQGVTVLVSTPYMDEAARCHRVAFMYQGRVLAEDTPANLRQGITHTILQVRCRPQRVARETLKQMAGVEGVEVFGDRLHVALRAGADPSGLEQALTGAGVECEEIRQAEPSLEDVFVALAME
jgi:ABC-2 type transport system ATP-binding protein